MLKHYVKLFEMGSSHIQPAWESNNNNKKKWRAGGRGQRHCCSGFSPPEPLVWGARRGREGGWCGAGRGPPAQWAQFPAGVGRPRRFLRGEASAGGRGWGWGGGDTGGRAGCAAGGGSSATCVALGLAPVLRQAVGARSSAPPGLAHPL